jgi:tetratricopeptide (TPR) repeat protein
MRTLYALALAALIAIPASAQNLTAPPDGDNQRSSVTQNLGLVKVTIDYSSPRVHRKGEDRRGKIWGKLVPYGMQKTLGYGTCTECPWRGGANENTTFTASHDVKIEGKTLPAGSYGLHIVPMENADWTLIFSKDAGSWGSFWYEPSHDALRVNVKPAKGEYHEWLTYEFPERELDKATAAMMWEDVALPFHISVDNLDQLYINAMRDELHGALGSNWQTWNDAARFALQHKIAAGDALAWATQGSRADYGWENYVTLSTLAMAQEANGLSADAAKTRTRALAHPSATAADIHQYARALLAQGKKQEALEAWQLNQKRYGDAWPVNVGLARGNSAVGKYKEALKYAKLALAQAPDEGNKKMLQTGIEKLEAGKDMN